MIKFNKKNEIKYIFYREKDIMNLLRFKRNNNDDFKHTNKIIKFALLIIKNKERIIISFKEELVKNKML